jgi:uncharacterized membrane protein
VEVRHGGWCPRRPARPGAPPEGGTDPDRGRGRGDLAGGPQKPKTEQLRNLTGAGALGGSFWGLLFGLLFFIPLLGLAIGAAMGALSGSMADVGIDDSFIKKVRDEITEGTSALFVMSGTVVPDKVLGEFKGTGAHLVSTNLSAEQEARLREVFAEEPTDEPSNA